MAARIAPKALSCCRSALLWLLAAGAAALVGRLLARSVEEITEAAARIAEGELAHLPRGQGREMRRLSRALASMRRELEGRPYAAAFLRDAWHDLKTPAAAMKATVGGPWRTARWTIRRRARFLANLRRSSEQLERTLDDLVTLARLETSTLAEERVALAQIARTALDHVRPLADAKGRDDGDRGAADAPLRCDPEAVSRALANLLDNAVKATPSGHVGVVGLGDAPTPSRWRSRTSRQRCRPTCATACSSAAATSRKGSGSGLGLAITRAAVEAHGGVVRFLELGPPRVRVRVELPR